MLREGLLIYMMAARRHNLIKGDLIKVVNPLFRICAKHGRPPIIGEIGVIVKATSSSVQKNAFNIFFSDGVVMMMLVEEFKKINVNIN